jgi:hypothetical protein
MAHLGRVFVFHGIKLNCNVWRDGSTDLGGSLSNPGARRFCCYELKNHTDYLQPVVRQSSDGMLQRPTVLRFPTREHRQREMRCFLSALYFAVVIR